MGARRARQDLQRTRLPQPRGRENRPRPLQQTRGHRALPEGARYPCIHSESKRLAKYNAALRRSLELAAKFQEGLPFLGAFVQSAKLAGAKEYRKIKTQEVLESELRFTPYEVKQVTSSFQAFMNE